MAFTRTGVVRARSTLARVRCRRSGGGVGPRVGRAMSRGPGAAGDIPSSRFRVHCAGSGAALRRAAVNPSGADVGGGARCGGPEPGPPDPCTSPSPTRVSRSPCWSWSTAPGRAARRQVVADHALARRLSAIVRNTVDSSRPFGVRPVRPAVRCVDPCHAGSPGATAAAAFVDEGGTQSNEPFPWMLTTRVKPPVRAVTPSKSAVSPRAGMPWLRHTDPCPSRRSTSLCAMDDDVPEGARDLPARVRLG